VRLVSGVVATGTALGFATAWCDETKNSMDGSFESLPFSKLTN